MSTTIKQKVQYQLEFNGVNQASSAVKQFGDNSGQASTSADKLAESVFKGTFAAEALQKAIHLAAQAVKMLTDYFKESALAAADVNEQWNKFRVVMGENAQGVANELSQIAEASNRDRYELIRGAAAMQDLIYPMGVARQQAAGMSADFVALAVDISSLNNVDMDTALGAFSSGIAGMSRPLRQFGIDVRLTAVNAELLNMGIRGGTEAATEAERIQAIYNIAMRQSSDALGDAERTAGRARNVMRGFSSDMSEASVNIGQSFIPVIEELTPMLRDEFAKVFPQLKELANDLADFLLEHGPEAIGVVRDLAINLLAVTEVGLAFTDFVVSATEKTIEFNQSLNWAGDTANWLINPVSAASGAILKFAKDYAEAEAALSEWDDAADRATVTEQAATLVTALYADAMEGTAEQAEFLIRELETLESQGANVGTILDNLRERHEELTHEIEIGNLVVGELTAKTADLTMEQINDARAAIKLALAQEELNSTLAVGPTMVAARIAELQAYRVSLDELAAGLGTVTTAAASASGGRATAAAPPTPERARDGSGIFGKDDLAERAQLTEQFLEEENERLMAFYEDQNQIRYDAELASWQARREMALEYGGEIIDTFFTSWDNGFQDLDKQFGKLLIKWMKDLVKTGFLNFVSSMFSGGIIGGGLGKLLKGKGGGLAK